jgi:hypothetical protein
MQHVVSTENIGDKLRSIAEEIRYQRQPLRENALL